MAFVDLFRSKLLAVGGIVLFVTCLATLLAAFSPFWYILSLDYRHGADQYSGLRNINVGLFFMDENRFINMLMIEKAGNDFFMPHMMRVGQIFYILGATGMIVCCAAAFILGFRSYTSVTGELCLAAGTTPVVLSLVIAVVFAALSPRVDNTWSNLPVPDPVPDRFPEFFLNNAEPASMDYNWGFFVAALAAVCAIIGAIILWIQAIMTCNKVKSFRYHSLHSKLPEEEPAPVHRQPYTQGRPQYGRQQVRLAPPSKHELDL